VFLADNIQTGEGSMAVIHFDDGTRLAVRPNSNVSVITYRKGEDAQARLDLHQGGVRASTGDIAKNSADSFKIVAGAATVTAQQAEYSVRLCEEDCQQEQSGGGGAEVKKAAVIGRVVRIEGEVTAQIQLKPDAPERRLRVASSLYRNDKVTSDIDSHAVLQFIDDSKLTIQADSVFDINSFYYGDETQPDQASFTLVKGGLRALSGAIGKTDPEAYAMNTPVATIGIRGTLWDVICRGEDCISDNPATSAISPDIRLGDEEGLYTWVHDGAISQLNATGEHVLAAPAGNFIGAIDRPPLPLPTIPVIMQSVPAPRPDTVDEDTSDLFSVEVKEEADPGVYVTVHDGDVDLTSGGASVNLGTLEAGYIGATGDAFRLDKPQQFQSEDRIPSPVDFDVQQAETGLFSLLSDDVEVFACTPD
jgi:hypothetical protein